MEIAEIQPELTAHFLQLVASKRLSHAYLFVGGFGNADMAIFLAQRLFCENVQADGAPCGSCRACRLIAEEAFADLHVVAPIGQTIKVEQIQELLASFVTRGFESNRKVVIIKEAEKLGTQSANRLLKSIEEPDRDTTIFLLADNENRILPTIRSRTQLVRFPKRVSYLVEQLEQAGALRSEAELLAEVCNSSDEAAALHEETWFREGSRQLADWVKRVADSPDEAFLAASGLAGNFEDKAQQEIAFKILLVLFDQARAADLAGKTFAAMRYWRSSVRFQSALESIIL